jgi:hypothetical protein
MDRYAAYGLRIESDIPLPLPVKPPADELSPVSVRWSAAPPLPPDAVFPYAAEGFRYAVFDHSPSIAAPSGPQIYVRIERCMDILIDEDAIAIIDPVNRDDAGDLVARLALLFVLQLRRKLCFHGSAAIQNGAAVAVFGRKGAGKSTAATGLAHRGWALLCDDSLVVDADGDVPVGACRARLNADSYARFSSGRTFSAALADRDGKFIFEPRCSAESAPLSLAIAIRPAAVGKVRAIELKGYAKLEALLLHLHSPSGIGDPAERLKQTLSRFSGTPFFVIDRPADRFALDELLDTIENLAARFR